MSEPAFVTYPRQSIPQLVLIHGGGGRNRSEKKGLSRLTIIFAVLLAVTQVADAFLTYHGLERFGHEAEGNLLLAYLCAHLGTAQALFLAKSFSLTCISILCVYAREHAWLPIALCGLLIIHISLAIVPWSCILI